MNILLSPKSVIIIYLYEEYHIHINNSELNIGTNIFKTQIYYNYKCM